MMHLKEKVSYPPESCPFICQIPQTVQTSQLLIQWVFATHSQTPGIWIYAVTA